MAVKLWRAFCMLSKRRVDRYEWEYMSYSLYSRAPILSSRRW